MDVTDKDLVEGGEITSLHFDMLTPQDMEFGDLVERILLARYRLKQETGQDCITIMECVTRKLEKYVERKIEEELEFDEELSLYE